MQETEPVEAVPEDLDAELARMTAQALIGQIADLSMKVAQRDVQIFKLTEMLAQKDKMIDAFGAQQEEKS